jgi:ABC-type multidrug transport system fused ATPase/permease subunit
MLGTVTWVAFRLAMPWPLKGLVEAAFPGHREQAAELTATLQALGDPVLQLCALYIVCALGLAIGDLVQRAAMGRFATGVVDDLRSAALRGASRKARPMELGGDGDLIARLIGDAARMREHLRGICVHAAQNTLLFLAIVAIMLVLAPRMGLFFLAGGLIATAIGYRASLSAAKSAGRKQAHEGAYAATIDAALARGNLAQVAELEGLEVLEDDELIGTSFFDAPTLHIHAVLAVTVVAAMLSGLDGVRAGTVSPGSVFLFVAYALTVHRRLVQVGRQLGRVGKVRASIDRLAALLHEDQGDGTAVVVRPLFSALRVVQGRLDSARGHGDSARLRSFDLTIPAGSRVAVIGKPGAGKSSLLRVIAGLEPLAEGALYWDDVAFEGAGKPSLAYLSQDPLFPPQKVASLLGLDAGAELSADQRTLLERTGALEVIERLPRGLADKVAALSLSKQEARALSLAAILLGPSSVWVLDAPLESLGRTSGEARMREIAQRARGHTLIVSMPKLYAPECFDRVVALKRGKQVFVGTPAEWAIWKDAPEEASSCEG